jgi:hypothetical protein
MKKLTAILFFAIFALTLTFNANAQETKNTDPEKHRIDIRVNKDNLVVLRADLMPGQKRLRYVLNVYNEKGDMLYAATFLSKRPVYKPFDLSTLPEGKYTFTVSHKIKQVYSKAILNKMVKKTEKTKQLLAEEL